MIGTLEVEEAKDWFEQKIFSLNVNKTQELVCSLSRQNHSQLEEVKVLGFVLDPNSTWKNYIHMFVSNSQE